MRRGKIARYDIVKRLAMGLLLFAFFLEGYAGQAHFHKLPTTIQSTLDIAVANGDGPAADLPANLPDRHNDKCFICHLTGLGSITIDPPVLVLRTLGPAVWLIAAHADAVVSARGLFDHAPRGPPISVVPA